MNTSNPTRKALPGLLLMLPLASALAQEQADTKDDGLAIEQITVTAQKRGENLQEVPLAVSVLTNKDLERGNIQTFQDIQYSVPNLTMATYSPFATTVNMRGVPSNPNGVFNSGTSPGLGIYVDGVVYGRATGFNQELSNIERVEVLRGPQGTLFGQNTNLGVVNITTRKPSDLLEGKLKLDLGNDDLRRVNGYVSGPLVENLLAASLTGFSVKRDGFQTNLADGSKLQDEDRYGGRAQFRLTPSDKLTIDISADRLKEDSTPPGNRLIAVSPYGLAAVAFYNAGATASDFTTSDKRDLYANSNRLFGKRDNWGLDATLSYLFDNGYQFKSITARKQYDSTAGTDLDGTSLDIYYSVEQENDDQFTQEFQLISPADKALRYVAGLFYLNNDSDNDQFFGTGTGIYGIPTGLSAPYPTSFNADAGNGVTLGGDVKTQSAAAFGNLTYDFTDRYSGFVGLRYSEVEKKMAFFQQGFATSLPGLYLNNYVDIPETHQKQNDNFVSWTTGLNASISGLTELPMHGYAKVSRGYKEGGYNFRPQSLEAIGGDASHPDMSFGKETVTSYEIGLKSDLLGRRMRLNLAAFYLDYEDIQTRVVDDSGVNRVVNGPAATSKGLEAELTFRATEGLSIKASGGYADATFDSFHNCASNSDCTGNQLPGASKWTATLGLSYTRTVLKDWDLLAGADYSYHSRMYQDARNLEATRLNASNRVDARLGLVSASGNLEVMLWAKNLFNQDDQAYLQDLATSDLSISTDLYTPPRTFGVSFTYSYY
ncbi:TonB-dependent receptor [Gallaecimonas pentaromativorans]|uniref:Iron complex outermembrane receptor protein n=1 Tax=Gallaecimonas pentaromativorans TaxID=584787 RepID=A0A3N1P6X7_9GAMM|nr:TonB-dependent receptor [Gallaecimonas pentaromativorans]ROQ22490.1 iron complex outermembrane receptor protein [Gallaecimonas pentaromativorans]